MSFVLTENYLFILKTILPSVVLSVVSQALGFKDDVTFKPSQDYAGLAGPIIRMKDVGSN